MVSAAVLVEALLRAQIILEEVVPGLVAMAEVATLFPTAAAQRVVKVQVLKHLTTAEMLKAEN